jgi:hypothetical protein
MGILLSCQGILFGSTGFYTGRRMAFVLSRERGRAFGAGALAGSTGIYTGGMAFVLT